MKLATAIADGQRALAATSTAPRLEAEMLLHYVTGLDRTQQIAQPDRWVNDAEHARYSSLVKRRQSGEPIAYLTGRRDFWTLELGVSPATLIPRHETELLVERALTRLTLDVKGDVVDLGTGSGAIALAIADELPRLRVVATDRSEEALAVARANARRLEIKNVQFLAGDWFAPLAGRRFCLIVSNPPYIRAGDPHLTRGDLRFEPPEALIGGDDGLDAIRHIAAQARAHLVPHGYLLLEHGYDQAPDVRELLKQRGYENVVSCRDYAGHERITECRAP